MNSLMRPFSCIKNVVMDRRKSTTQRTRVQETTFIHTQLIFIRPIKIFNRLQISSRAHNSWWRCGHVHGKQEGRSDTFEDTRQIKERSKCQCGTFDLPSSLLKRTIVVVLGLIVMGGCIIRKDRNL